MDLSRFVDIKAVVFDLDGVLVDSRELHFRALNWALAKVGPSYPLTVEEHLAKYDGRPTKTKLAMLTADKQLDPELYDQVWRWKQEHTLTLIQEHIQPDEKLQAMFAQLKSQGLQLFCASNSTRNSLVDILERLGVLPLLDRVYSNEDVVHPKPHPNIYVRCFADNGLTPQQCVVVEDSPIGRTAAELSGAHVCVVTGTHDVELSRVQRAIDLATEKNRLRKIDTRWPSDVQVVIPMAGEGSRFVMAGYDLPKPLIDVRGRPMISWVTENLSLAAAKFIFVVRESHLQRNEWNLEQRLRELVPNCEIVIAKELTEGPACTVLLAEHLLDPEKPLLIANSDQYLEWDVNAFLYESDKVDGCISVFHQPDPNDAKWSYAKLDQNGFVEEVQEKKVISDIATTGVYYWRRAKHFVHCAKRMIEKRTLVGKEFYVCPAYNEAIAEGLKIKVSYCTKMWGLGVPADLEEFLRHH